METRIVSRHRLPKSLQLLAMMLLALCSACVVRAQDGRWNFNIGGGIGFPTGDLGTFINDGGNFVVGGGYNVNKWLSTNGEFMWQDLPVNSSTKDALQTPGRIGPPVCGDLRPGGSLCRSDISWELMRSEVSGGTTARVKQRRRAPPLFAIPTGRGGTAAPSAR